MKYCYKLFVLLGLSSVATAAAPTTQPVNELAPVGQGLSAVLSKSDASDDQIKLAVITARDGLPKDSESRRKLDAMLSGEMDRKQAMSIAKDISFTPTMEAPTPRAWPDFTPVGEVQLKQYPKYRIAYVNRGDTLKGGEFMTLFFHIQRNDIPMTAPVEMKMSDDQRPAMKQMAFLYENADVGKIGDDGKVTVVDVAAMDVVSVGGRGDWSASSMTDSRELLDQWLANHPEYQPAGDLRVMGYNSPSMSKDKRYHEVQQPVERKP